MARVFVENPAVTPWRNGLASVMTVTDMTDPHVLNGVDFQSDSCGDASPWPDHCSTQPGPDPDPVEGCDVTVTATVEPPCMCDVEFTITVTDAGGGESAFQAEATAVDETCTGIEVLVTLNAPPSALLPQLEETATVNGGPVALGVMDLSGFSGQQEFQVSFLAADHGLGVSSSNGTQANITFGITDFEGVGEYTASMFCSPQTLADQDTCPIVATLALNPVGGGMADILAITAYTPNPGGGEACARDVVFTIDNNTYTIPNDQVSPFITTLGQVASPGVYPASITDSLTGATQSFTLYMPALTAGFGGVVSAQASFLSLSEFANPIMVSATSDGEGCADPTVINVTVDGGEPVQVTVGDPPTLVGTMDYGQTVEIQAGIEGVTAGGDLMLPEGGCVEPGDCESIFVLNAPAPGPAPGGVKTFHEGIDFDHGEPFTVVFGAKCKLVDPDEFRGDVQRGFSYVEQKAVEAAFWTGFLGNFPALATDPHLVVLPAASSVEDGVSELEEFISRNYGGVGVIHAPRLVAPYAADSGLIVKSGGLLETPLGTLWAFGGGYNPASGPDGEQPPMGGQVWMYVTGGVVGRRGPLMVNPQDAGVLHQSTNEMTVVAERTWVLTRDCVTAAVLVMLDAV